MPRSTALFAASLLAAGAGVGALAVPTGTTATAHPSGAAERRPVVSTADVVVRPTARLGRRTKHPLDTAQCRNRYHYRCYGPGQVQQAYDLPSLFSKGITGKGQTIAIVDSFGSPTIRHDLKVFDHTYSLPAPPKLRVVQPAGPVPAYKPSYNRAGWAGETTLDVEYAHAMAPGAKLLLVETPSSENEGTSGFPDIVKAESKIIRSHHPAVVSQSFSATEQTFPTRRSLVSLRGAYRLAANRGTSVLAASGDSGAADVMHDGSTYYLHPVTSWPDSDPLVTGVGGTKLTLDSSGHATQPATVWNDTHDRALIRLYGAGPDAGGGGRSVIFGRPGFQHRVAGRTGNHRGVPDISMSGACSGAVETYSSFTGEPKGWSPTCGTSEATPLFAGIVALAAQVAGHPLGDLNPALYRLSAHRAAGVVDVTKGTTTVSLRRHGATHTVHGARARRGYDLASGIGTVDGATFVPELARAAG